MNSLDERYAWYRQLHGAGPIHTLDSGAHLVVGHHAVAAGLREPRFHSNKKTQFFARFAKLAPDVRSRLEFFYSGWLMYMDGDHHREYRALTARALGSFSENLTTHARTFCEARNHSGHIDVLEEFARPWVRQAMPLFLGCSRAAYEQMLAASCSVLDFFIGRRSAPKDAESAAHAYEVLTQHLLETPGQQGFLASLNAAMPDDPLAVPLAASIIADTWEPVVALLAAGLLHGCGHINRDSIRDRTFFREVLRVEAPFQICNRVVGEDGLSIAGVPMTRGQRVSFVIGAANRDPTVFREPDRFDPNRAELGSALSFGAGPHACIGGRLAEEVCRAGWTGFASTFPIARLRPKAFTWRPVFGLRILDELVLETLPSTDCAEVNPNECQAY